VVIDMSFWCSIMVILKGFNVLLPFGPYVIKIQLANDIYHLKYVSIVIQVPIWMMKGIWKNKLNLVKFYIKCNYNGFTMFSTSISILLWPNMAPPSLFIWTYDFATTLVLGLWSKFAGTQIKIVQELSQNMGENKRSKTHSHN